MKTCGLLAAFLLLPGFVFAQGTVTGRVTDMATGETLPGASVTIENTTMGAATSTDGRYSISNVPAGTYVVTASFIGFETATQTVRVGNGSVTVNFGLEEVNMALDAIEVFASRAVDRQTPVAYSNVEKAQIQQQLGSRDIPLVLNTTPSVYATDNGGGAGDSRINVRGFDQRNTAVMINGVPVNDMENGWVYWSNWDGVGDVTTSIQLQRGLSAVNLATPSIGGTLNIITDPAQNARGLMFKQEVGDGGFFKSTLSASTGLINGKYAFTALGVRKTGNGIVDATWTDSWAYYLSGSYFVNSKHTLQFFAVGAPQRHGQNLYRQNIGVYDQEFARGLDSYDTDAFSRYSEGGRFYNQTWNTVSPSYEGDQAVENSTFSRFDNGFINERENFYHKPQVNLNWYAQFTDDLILSTVLYYSGGSGGGTGTIDNRIPYGDGRDRDGDGRVDQTGAFIWDYASQPTRVADWDANIAMNRGTTDRQGNAKEAGRSLAILRNSRNNQWTIGAISKVGYDITENFVIEAGVDWRTAEIEHYREVRDLLGGDYYVDTSSDFWSEAEQRRSLGDKIAYDNTNTVGWIGGFVQSEIEVGNLTAFAMGGVSQISYTYEDFFRDGGNGSPLVVESGNLQGFQTKGGALYRVNDALGVYANLGYISKVPIFDGVIDDGDGTLNPDPTNETFQSFEAGANFRVANLALKLSAYSTYWKDRTVVRGLQTQDGTDALVNLTGVNALHQGVELEAAFQPTERLRFDGGISTGDWRFTDDATGIFRADEGAEGQEFGFFIDGLKVGDQPQTQFSYAATVYPTDGLYAQVVGRTYSRHFAAFDPLSRTSPNYPWQLNSDGSYGDRGVQSWRAPDYTVFDINLGYDLPLNSSPVDVRVTANIFNVLDETYIQDATDNSRFNAWDGDHDADDAEVYFGLPRRFNVGITVTY
ncbi:MAG: TonB-dependent receptor [Rhodothermales bacterium]